jgi:predicted nucleic acid-binding Zn ribbon protein
MGFRNFHSLLDIIKKAQTKYPNFSQRLSEAEALGRWQIAVGDLIAKHSRAIRVQGGVLWVEVDHPAWKSELHYRKQQILNILNGKSPSAKPGLSKDQETLTDILYFEPRTFSRNTNK